MTSDRWYRIEVLYHEMLARPVYERAAALSVACAGDAALQAEVQSLLDQPESAAGFLATPAMDLAAQHVSPATGFLTGRRIGAFEVQGLLGVGGMGEVYRARDSRLGREVAIKILPRAFKDDPHRRARFEREAQLLASLNHPRIGAIYGLEDADGVTALVMELVEGEDLSQRLARGKIPIDEALPIAKQIAEALEAAHEQGIIHRDLKPANIKVRSDGTVKVLDFGLAKAMEPTGAMAASVSMSPTITTPAMTQAGMILGTAAYMSPEQAKGQAVDRRADIFAFGCVLFEMLTGRRAFYGESVQEIMSQVLQREPDWSRLRPGVPLSLHRLLRLCLKKDPKKRRQTAADVRIDLENALSDSGSVQPQFSNRRSKISRLVWIACALVLLAALAVPTVTHLREVPAVEMRLQIVTPPSLDPLHFALSPDGRHIVYVVSGASSEAPQRLYLRALDKSDAQPLAGTDGALFPFWSPDSRSVGFFASGKLLRIDIAGGPAQVLAPAVNPLGGAWSDDGTILYSPNTVSPLFRVPSTGGAPVAATELDSPRQSYHRRPSFLPHGRQFLFFAMGEPAVAGIYLGSLDGGKPKRLTAADSPGVYLAPGRVVFLQDGNLVARQFNAERKELVGDPVTLADKVGAGDSVAEFSISSSGIVAYRKGRGAPGQQTWFDRTGKVLGQLGSQNAADLSPDGRFVAYDRFTGSNRDVWILDLDRGGNTPFTHHPNVDGFPVWSKDGSRIAFESQRKGNFDLMVKLFTGVADSEQFLLETPDNEWPLNWSMDDRFLLYQKSDQNYGASDLLALPIAGTDRTPIVIANTRFEERMGDFSPDGRWVTYETDESGQPEIVVQSFPEPHGILRVSTTGGSAPRWNIDGKEIFFIAPDGKMMAVPVAPGATFIPGIPKPLFPTHIVNQRFKYQYAVSHNGRFLINNRQIEEASTSPITLILNWKP